MQALPKMKPYERNICTCVNKNDWLLLNGPFISYHSRNEIHYIFPAMKSNFISGSKFRFGSHVNTVQVRRFFLKLNCKISQLYTSLRKDFDKTFMVAFYNSFLKIEL